MKKIEKLQSTKQATPWTEVEDEIASKMRLLFRQLQHPAHPVNALDTLGPVRIVSLHGAASLLKSCLICVRSVSALQHLVQTRQRRMMRDH